MSRIHEKQLSSVHETPAGERNVGWFCITDIIKKKTKNGKDFYRLKVINDDYQTVWLRVWGQMKDSLESYTLWVADVHHDENWGFSTSCWKMRRISSFD